MTRAWKRGWRELIVLLAALACAGSWAAGQVRSMRDRSEVAKMTEKQKTICVGRYLIDVPSEAEVSLSGGMLGGFEVHTREEGETEFRERIAGRELEIKGNGNDPESNGPGGMIQVRQLHVPNMTGRTFIHGRTRTRGIGGGRQGLSEYVSVEAHAHTGGMSFTLSMQYANEADIALAEALLARLQIKGNDEIPTAPGFCVSGAVFTEPLPIHNNENVVMNLRLPNHPDLALALFSIAGAKPGPGILSRTAEADAATSAEELLRVTKLRTRKRRINGMEGEEILERVREFNFATTYGFNWETRGSHEDALQPYLSLELQTGIGVRPGGKPVDTSLHEDALLSLWDSIASSIRIRKNGPPPLSDSPDQPKGPKLGAVATSGDVCPQSGWWRCNEGGPGMDVHGGQAQYIRQGGRMPQALLLPHQTLWQKLNRIRPSIEASRPTVWTLIDKRERPRSSTAVAIAPSVMSTPEMKPVVGDRPKVLLGTYLRTGQVCPASGWWRCDEPQALDGTRWFAQGSLMPAATFQVPAGVFAKSRGPELIQRRSTWQLMRHAEVPVRAQDPLPFPDDSPVDKPPNLA